MNLFQEGVDVKKRKSGERREKGVHDKSMRQTEGNRDGGKFPTIALKKLEGLKYLRAGI